MKFANTFVFWISVLCTLLALVHHVSCQTSSTTSRLIFTPYVPTTRTLNQWTTSSSDAPVVISQSSSSFVSPVVSSSVMQSTQSTTSRVTPVLSVTSLTANSTQTTTSSTAFVFSSMATVSQSTQTPATLITTVTSSVASMAQGTEHVAPAEQSADLPESAAGRALGNRPSAPLRAHRFRRSHSAAPTQQVMAPVRAPFTTQTIAAVTEYHTTSYMFTTTKLVTVTRTPTLDSANMLFYCHVMAAFKSRCSSLFNTVSKPTLPPHAPFPTNFFHDGPKPLSSASTGSKSTTTSLFPTNFFQNWPNLPVFPAKPATTSSSTSSKALTTSPSTTTSTTITTTTTTSYKPATVSSASTSISTSTNFKPATASTTISSSSTSKPASVTTSATTSTAAAKKKRGVAMDNNQHDYVHNPPGLRPTYSTTSTALGLISSSRTSTNTVPSQTIATQRRTKRVAKKKRRGDKLLATARPYGDSPSRPGMQQGSKIRDTTAQSSSTASSSTASLKRRATSTIHSVSAHSASSTHAPGNSDPLPNFQRPRNTMGSA